MMRSNCKRNAARAAAVLLPLMLAPPVLAQSFGGTGFQTGDGSTAIPGGGSTSSFGFNNFGSDGYLSCGLGGDPACLIEINLSADVEDDDEVVGFSLNALGDDDPVLIRYRNKDERWTTLGLALEGGAGPDPDNLDIETTLLLQVLEEHFTFTGDDVSPAYDGSDPLDLDFADVGDGFYDVTIVVPKEASELANDPLRGTVGAITPSTFDCATDTVDTGCTGPNPDVEGAADFERQFKLISDWIVTVRVSVNSPVTPNTLLSTTGDLCHSGLDNSNSTFSEELCNPENPLSKVGFIRSVGVAPEPGPLVLLGIGLAALGLTRVRPFRRS